MAEKSSVLGENTKLVVTAIVLAGVVIAVAGGIYFMNQGSESKPNEISDYGTFTNENYGLSFTYPSSWSLDNYKYYGVLIVTVSENSTPGDPSAGAQIYAGSLGYPSMDNMKEQVAESAENNEK